MEMKASQFMLYMLLGVCAVLWGICVIQVVFIQKPPFVAEEVHVTPSISYGSTFRSSSAIHLLSPIRHHSGLATAVVQTPRAVMRSTSQHAVQAPMKIHTTSSQRVAVAGGGGMGNSPISTGSSSRGGSSRGIIYSQSSALPQVQGLLASASVAGGATSSQIYDQMARSAAPMKAPKTSPTPPLPDGVCGECHWVYDPISGQWTCSQCGANVLDGCACEEESGYCWCPIDFNWAVALFMAILAAAYGLYKKRTQTVQSRP